MRAFLQDKENINVNQVLYTNRLLEKKKELDQIQQYIYDEMEIGGGNLSRANLRHLAEVSPQNGFGVNNLSLGH